MLDHTRRSRDEHHKAVQGEGKHIQVLLAEQFVDTIVFVSQLYPLLDSLICFL